MDVHRCDELKPYAGAHANDPVSVVYWFATLIGAKVNRALTGLVEYDGDRSFPPDHEGSAKVALLSVDRSVTAWRDLMSIGRVSERRAGSFIADLEFLREALEMMVPKARDFVRPGLDEPDEVKMLDAAEC
jgi:hypothetical protein